MTSNIGSQKIMEQLQNEDANSNSHLQAGRDKLEKELMQDLQHYFKPELLNRLDDIIIFNPITQETLLQIVDIQLKWLQKLLATEKQITLEISKEAKAYLWRLGRDPALGARPLKRAIQRYVLDEIAMMILEGKVQEGQKITVEMKGDVLDFQVK